MKIVIRFISFYFSWPLRGVESFSDIIMWVSFWEVVVHGAIVWFSDSWNNFPVVSHLYFWAALYVASVAEHVRKKMCSGSGEK